MAAFLAGRRNRGDGIDEGYNEFDVFVPSAATTAVEQPETETIHARHSVFLSLSLSPSSIA